MWVELILPILPFLQDIGLSFIASWLYDLLKKEKNTTVLQNIEQNASLIGPAKIEINHSLVILVGQGSELTTEGRREKLPSFSPDLPKLVSLDALTYLYPKVTEKLERDAAYGFQYYLAWKKFKETNSPYFSELDAARNFFERPHAYRELSRWINIFARLDENALIEPLVVWVAENLGNSVTQEQFTAYVKKLGEKGLQLGDHKLDGKTVSIIFVGGEAKPPKAYLPRCAGILQANKIIIICSRGEFYNAKANKITSLILEMFSGVELKTRHFQYMVSYRKESVCVEFMAIYAPEQAPQP